MFPSISHLFLHWRGAKSTANLDGGMAGFPLGTPLGADQLFTQRLKYQHAIFMTTRYVIPARKSVHFNTWVGVESYVASLKDFVSLAVALAS